jgi:ABC-type bacteriocin/lantibiotic exporter with double-glycine peptidase domain
MSTKLGAIYNLNEIDRTIYVSQNATVFPGTVRENLFLPCDNDEALARDLCVELELCKPDDVSDFLCYELGSNNSGLSGGQLQRLSLMRALIQRPSILLMDEALSGVDAHLEQKLLLVLLEKGITLVYVSHHDSVNTDSWGSWTLI